MRLSSVFAWKKIQVRLLAMRLHKQMEYRAYPNAPLPRLPLWIHTEGPSMPENKLWLKTAIACEPWNAIRPTFQLVESAEVADAFIVWGDTTWASMASHGERPVLHVEYGDGPDWSHFTDYWLPHELGHLLGLRDWIRPDTDPQGYINPGIASDEYVGVMSYGASREQWFGDHDRKMLKTLWP